MFFEDLTCEHDTCTSQWNCDYFFLPLAKYECFSKMPHLHPIQMDIDFCVCLSPLIHRTQSLETPAPCCSVWGREATTARDCCSEQTNAIFQQLQIFTRFPLQFGVPLRGHPILIDHRLNLRVHFLCVLLPVFSRANWPQVITSIRLDFFVCICWIYCFKLYHDHWWWFFLFSCQGSLVFPLG